MMDYLATFVLLIGLAGARGCGDPPVISGSENDLTGAAPYPEGTRVTYSCRIGYRASGYSNVYTCQGGAWQGGPYTCTEILCPYFFEKPKNGFIVGNPTYQINTRLMFDCYEGYDLIGTSTIRCMIDGWTPTSSLPTCKPKDCGEFGEIEHASVFQETPDGVRNDYGSVVIVSCKDGYTASGPAKVYCQADGKWGKKPECVASQCPDYPGLNYTKCLKASLVRSDSIYMYCLDGTDAHKVTKMGDGTSALCKDSKWSDTSLACLCNCECKSNDAEVEFDNCNANGYLAHEGSLSWHCKARSHKKTSSAVKCFDGDFIEEPECELDPTDPPRPTDSTDSTDWPNNTTPIYVPLNGKPVLYIIIILLLVAVLLVIIWCCCNFFHSLFVRTITETLSCLKKIGMCLFCGWCKSCKYDCEHGVKCHKYCFNCCLGGPENVHDESKKPLKEMENIDHSNIRISAEILGIQTEDEHEPNKLKALTQDFLDKNYPASQWIQVYTKRGSEVVIQFPGDRRIPIALPHAELSTNPEAGQTALLKATNRLLDEKPDTNMVFLTDSNTVLKKLKAKDESTQSLWSALINLPKQCQIVLQWIPSQYQIQ